MDIEELAFKYALKNALDYGKANPKAVLGKVISENPELKPRIKEIIAASEKACNAINSMTKDQIAEAISGYTFAEKKKDDEVSLSLPFSERFKQVITRFPPEPNGYPHIGHAKAAFLGLESSKLHGGKFLIRFDDTNPEKEKQEYVEAILEDLEWLGIKPDILDFASDHMEQIYGFAERLIAINRAYVCVCDPDSIREKRQKRLDCPCRENPVEKNLGLWKEMFSTMPEGKAILRLKGDMASENTTMRDPTLARIMEHEHYRQGTKFRVYPNYDLQAPVMDHLNGVTHAIRSKEYELRDESYNYLLKSLGIEPPIIVSISRLAIEGYPISKRLLQPLISEGKVLGWDDPRLPTIGALRRRGITPEAIKRFVLLFGFSKVESVLRMDRLYSENSKVINNSAKRLFCVIDPVRLEIKGNFPQSVELKLHPTEALGSRKISTSGSFWISRKDGEQLSQGDSLRLKDLCNIRVLSRSPDGSSIACEVVELDKMPEKKIQWVPSSGSIPVKVYEGSVPFKGDEFDPESLVISEGFAEPYVTELNIGEVIQFERYGFCRLDSKDNGSLTFIFSHR